MKPVGGFIETATSYVPHSDFRNAESAMSAHISSNLTTTKRTTNPLSRVQTDTKKPEEDRTLH